MRVRRFHAGFWRTPTARKGLVFLSNFGLAKAITYLAPLGIALVATAEVYGAIELAQSVGLLVTSLLFGAPLNGVTQLYLVKGERGLMAQLALVSIIGCLFGLMAYLLLLLSGASMIVQLVAVSLVVAAIHNVAGTFFRTLNYRNLTAWSDGFATLVAGAIVAVLVGLNRNTIEGLTEGYAVCAIIGLLGSVYWLTRTDRTRLRDRLIASIRIGLPMVVVGVLAIWLGAGGRIMIGFLNASELAAFGVAFRISGFALGVHQLMTTAFFARIYSARTRAADRILGGFLIAVGMLSLALGIGGRWLPELVTFSALDAASVVSYQRILPISALQTFYWIGYAMLQVRINRSRLAGPAIVPTIAVTAIGMAIIFAIGLLWSNDIVLLSWLIAAHAAAFFFTNVYVLARRGLPHKLITQVGTAGGLILTIAAALSGALY